MLFNTGLALGVGGRSWDEGEAGLDGFVGEADCSTELGTATVMNVSTRRDCKTFSNDLCVYFCHRLTVGTVPFPVDDIVDVVRERFDLEDITVPDSGGWLPEPMLVENSRALVRDTVRFLTLCSASSTELTVRDSSLTWSSCP